MLWLLSEYVKMRRGFLLDASALPLVPEKSYFSLLPVEIRSLAGFMYMRNELRRFEEMLCESSFEWDVVALSFDSSHFEKKAATHAECICWICRYKKENRRLLRPLRSRIIRPPDVQYREDMSFLKYKPQR